MVAGWAVMADIRVYLDGDGTAQGTVLAAFYQHYREEKGSVAIPAMEAFLFANYLLAHLDEFQAELKDYAAIWPDPPKL
jgi:hypothetical protein